MKVLIFWASYIWIPFAFGCLWFGCKRQGVWRWLALLALLASLPLAWARFIEPRLLFTVCSQHDLSEGSQKTVTIRAALFSDTHFGSFKHTIPMSRLVDRINREDVDIVFIAGDFMTDLPQEKVADALAPLADLNAPTYAVMGNHDVGFPGPNYGMTHYRALQKSGVITVENRAFEVELARAQFIVAGTSDLWQGQHSFAFSANLPEDKPVILLTHNPDIALRVPPDFEYAIMLAGHTHGGQVRLPIPGLTQAVIPTQYPFDTGLHYVPRSGEAKHGRVFVTPGTGMTGIPMRFRRPPRIDILELKLPVQ